MGGFDDVHLPLCLAKGAKGGPERRTDVITLASGAEVRNTPWAASRRRWTVGSAMGTLDDLQAVCAFFEARQGRLRSFRFRDPLDHASCPGGEPLGIGDGARTDFQLVKDYGDAEQSRPITKPVIGSVVVLVDGAEVSGWQVDAVSGLVQFTAAPAAGAVLTARFEFDCHVRFDTDQLDTVIEAVRHGRVARLDLVEVV
ncbi:MAG: DUF2460 domain-containing protein [Pseudomonadota bacterium]